MKPDLRLNFWKYKEIDIENFLSEIDDSTYAQLFTQIFSSAEIVIHCGAHKTATTFIR